MPDRWSDVLLWQVPATPSGVMDAHLPAYLVDRTQLAQAFLRRYAGLVGRINTVTNVANTRADIVANQSAECLYMVVTMACGDGEARTQFHESDIGDTDGDGAPEFIDAWGHPICFYRWAPGFDSLTQLSYPQLNEIRFKAVAAGLNSNVEVTKAVAKDHDPFDTFRLQPNAFRLVPLVFSAGGDEKLGLDLNVNYVPWRQSNSPATPLNVSPPYFPILISH